MVPRGMSAPSRTLAVLGLVITLGFAGLTPVGPAAADPSGSPALGAHYDKSDTNIVFGVYSSRATRIEICLYDQPVGADEKLRIELKPDAKTHVWTVSVPIADLAARGVKDPVYYGYRAWGPNWPYDPAWQKGSEIGFKSDVDGDGNRFNPNRLLIDPYAVELSHDPLTPDQADGTIYASGPQNRKRDTGKVAPKSIVLRPDAVSVGHRPTWPMKDAIVYEVHLRGLTMQDPSVPEAERGTYAGAARKAEYLKKLGVTAVEFLPVQECQNDRNDLGGAEVNYWGYSTLAFFAPDRRYARDKSPGGPTREFKAMVKAYHDRGIKVFLDVVYNHTGEGGLYGGGQVDTTNILSWRGLDNPTYYELTTDNRFYYDNTGVNGNFNCAHPIVRNLIVDSLQYWSQVMGVDGFRFDLAPLLGNTLTVQPKGGDGFSFDKLAPGNVLNRAVKELPVQPDLGGRGVNLIAEPWGASGPTQLQGQFPWGWAEWNDRFRDGIRRSQNKLGVDDITMGQLAQRIAGSDDLFRTNGRKPWHSINYLASHDGFCLRDLYTYTDGGQRAWNQGGDALLQRQATRNGFALPLLAAGVPMFTGGSEMYRTQQGSANQYNVDDKTSHLNWDDLKANAGHVTFARRIVAFRNRHPALRPADWFTGQDHNGNGLKDVTWYRDDGQEADAGYLDAKDRHFLAYRIDGTESKVKDPAHSIYVAYNSWSQPVTVTLPPASAGNAWFRAGDTSAWMEPDSNFRDPGQEDRLEGRTYEMKGRSILVLVER